MSKYIGATVVNLSVDTVDVTGDITATDATPEVIIVNDTHEDTDGGREGKVTFKGQQSGGEETTLAQIQASHDGTSDDEKGDLIFKTNDGSDGASPTEVMRIDSSGNFGVGIAPRAKVDIFGTGAGNARVLIEGESGADPYINFLANNTQHFSIGIDDSDSDKFKISKNSALGTNDFFTVDVDGNVGIGDTSPVSNTNYNALTITSTASTGGGQLYVKSSSVTGVFGADNTSDPKTILQTNTNHPIAFGTNGSEAMRIVDTAAHGAGLGIGTTAPLRQLHIHNTSANSEIAFTAGTSGTSSILFGDGQTGTDVYRGYIQYQHSSDSLLFGTAAQTFMTIQSSGDVLLSAMTAPTSSEQLALSVNSSVNFGIGIKGTSGSNNAVYARFYNSSGATAGEIAQSGSTSTNFTTSSDYRIKENLTDISDGITRVKQLSPKRFNFIGETDRTVDGFLAHEAQTVVPEAVTGTKDAVQVWKEGDDLPNGVSVDDNKLDDDGNTIPELQGIDQSKLVPLLTAALQEAIAKIETLETKVAALEGE